MSYERPGWLRSHCKREAANHLMLQSSCNSKSPLWSNSIVNSFLVCEVGMMIAPTSNVSSEPWHNIYRMSATGLPTAGIQGLAAGINILISKALLFTDASILLPALFHSILYTSIFCNFYLSEYHILQSSSSHLPPCVITNSNEHLWSAFYIQDILLSLQGVADAEPPSGPKQPLSYL